MENNTYSSQSEVPTVLATKSKKQFNPAVAGAIGAVAGLAVGAAGIYGLIKLTEKPQPCTCPDCISVKPHTSQGLDIVNYEFLRLESDYDNIIYSPLSIQHGLSLLNAGAKGTTKTEIEGVLGDAEVPSYQNIPDTLSLANAVFIRDTFKDKVLPSYTEKVQNNLGSEIIYDSFASSENMDNWVKQKTFNLIDSIGIQPVPDLSMVLANALAIQMDWKYQFDEDNTHGHTFYKKDGSEIEATTMSKTTFSEDIKYYQDDNTTAVSMPLKSTTEDVDLNFIAIMPSGNLDEYVGSVDQSQVSAVIENMTPASEPEDGVAISVPKFKFDYELKFKKDLQSLGIQTAFNKESAGFSEMASESLYVGEAIHKANIDFSEDGIKAAAITVFTMKENAMAVEETIPQPVIINLDHPFLFLIRDAKNGAIWFTGVVNQPNLWDDDKATYESA